MSGSSLANDGVRLAYAITGTEPKLAKAANWLNHLEYDWETPLYRQMFSRLARGFNCSDMMREEMVCRNGISSTSPSILGFLIYIQSSTHLAFSRFPFSECLRGALSRLHYSLRRP